MSLRPRRRFLLSQAGQRLFVTVLLVAGVAVFSPPGRGGPFFWGFGVLAIVAGLYALAVAIMARRMRLTLFGETIAYLEYFKPRSVSIDRAAAFELRRSRGRYGPGPLEGRVLGTDGQLLLHGIAAGAFVPLELIRLAFSIHKPIRGEPNAIVDWIRPSLRSGLGTPEPARPFVSGEPRNVINELRSRRASGRLRLTCQERTIRVDLIRGRMLRTAGVEAALAGCPQGEAQLSPLDLPPDMIDAIAETLGDDSYYVET